MVNPNGSYQLKNGKQKQLRNGECFDMEGLKYRSQDKLMQRIEKRNAMNQRQNKNQNKLNRPNNQMKGKKGKGGNN